MSHRRHRAAAALGALALALATVVVSAGPVASMPAASATDPGVPPWRWKTEHSQKWVGPGETVAIQTYCRAGYLPLTGGWRGEYVVDHVYTDPVFRAYHSLELVESFSDFTDRYYKVEVRNTGDVHARISTTAECVHPDEISGFVTAGSWFKRDKAGRAGGTVTCPAGFGVIGAGHEWSAAARHRRIDVSAPLPVGDGWYASGYSDQRRDRLWIEVECLPDAQLGGEQYAFVEKKTGGTRDFLGPVVCPAGTRILTVGVSARRAGKAWNPAVYAGRIAVIDEESAGGPTKLKATIDQLPQRAEVVVRAAALCIPVAQPRLLFDPSPPSGTTTSRDVSYTFYAQDSAGEDLVLRCWLNGFRQPASWCTSGESHTLTGLLDGTYTLRVDAENTSGQVASQSYTWTVAGAAGRATAG